ncbi:MAG: hypothetical protein H8E62_08040 [Planctomycetes bacterium]|nr:hypothetical protein [Planctomycetota bacterium]
MESFVLSNAMVLVGRAGICLHRGWGRGTPGAFAHVKTLRYLLLRPAPLKEARVFNGVLE